MFENGEQLVQYLTDAIGYLPAGYIFLLIYSHITPNDFSKSFEESFLRSVVAGYFLNAFYNKYILSLATFLGNPLYLLIFSVISAYALSKIISSRFFKKVMHILRINRHVARNIWCSISDEKYPIWATVYFRENNVCYQGEVVCFDDSSNTPQIVLSRYRKYLIKDGKIDDDCLLSDYTGDFQQRVLLNTEIADSVELWYDKDSKVVATMKKKLEEIKKAEEPSASKMAKDKAEDEDCSQSKKI